MAQAQTFIGPEEHAYNTYSGAHTGSNRRGRVWFPDGKIRTVTLGVPDTYFTIPAHATVAGHYVSGYVSVVDDSERPAGEAVQWEFHPYGCYWSEGHWAWGR